MSKFKVCAAVLASALVGVNAFGAECTYTDGAWDTAPSGESDDIVIVSGDLTWGAALPHKVASWRQEAGTVTFETTYGAAFPLFEVTGDVALNGGSWTHKANSDAETYRLNVKVCGDMTVAEEAVVDAYMKGFAATKGIGAPSQASSGWGGGAHGGRGYEGLAKVPCEPSVCYGSLTRPTELGAGSGQLRPVSGGGAICLVVVGSLTVDGLIDANGADTSVAGYSSGPGGSVWITAGRLLGGGSIEANANGLVCRGSTASSDYNVSGGGRVAVWLTGDGADFMAFNGKTTAYGAYLSGSVTEAAGPGTVYLKTAAQAEDEGTLIVDNGGAQARTFTDVGGSVTDTAVGRVLVSADSMLRLVDGGVLSVSGDIENHGSFTGVGDSTLEFVGAGVSKVSGDLSVSGFVCRTPGKGVVFGDGATLSVSGKFTLQGADGNPVVFAAAGDAESFNLNVASTAEQSVKNVSVAKCNASAGAKIVAIDSEKDELTTNWNIINIIPGQVIVWTGQAGDPGWLLADNWDLGRAPVETDCAVVNPADIQPVLTKQLAIAKLTVATGATLSLAGYNLTVTGDLAVAGAILPAGAETIAVGGNATLNADGLVAKRSTFVLNGITAQTFDPCGASFCNLVWDNSSAEGIAVSSSFSALYLTAQAVTARRIAFADGITATCSAGLVFSGDASTQNLALVPSVAGKTWNLAVSGTAAVSGVTVSGSQATHNQIYANDSFDAGGNAGWSFGTFVSSVWKGTSNSDFHTAANWDPAVVPDENAAVVIDSTRPVTISQPVTVRELVIGGTAATAVTLNKSIEVTGAMVLKDQATVTVNAKDAKIKVDSSLVMQSGSTVIHAKNSSLTDNPIRVDIEVDGDMVVEERAVVSGNGGGYPGNVGPGSGNTSAFAGGSHGGRGNASLTVGVCHGSLTKPMEVASGNVCSTGGGNAGGSVRVVVKGTLTNDGRITANGMTPQYYSATAGGSVWITAGRLSGSGAVEANAAGDNCETATFSTAHSMSGGGRVAVWLTDAGAEFDSFSGWITAYGARSSATSSMAPGTIYLKTGAQADDEGMLIIDNGGVVAAKPTEIGSAVTDARVGSVWVKEGTTLNLVNTGHLTVYGDIINEGTFSGVDESVLELAGSGLSSINGDIEVSGFLCREPGKTIAVADGKTVTVTGSFAVEGSDDSMVTLRSVSGTGLWGLSVRAEAEQSVKHVSVHSCDASSGAEVVANDSETDEQTKNWKTINIVPGETIVWTGAAGTTGWTSPANWDLRRAPAETDVIVINPAAVYPELIAHVVTSNLTITAGASLTLSGFNLTVNGDLLANGQLKATATEQIRVTGDVTFAANAFVKDHSTVTLDGSAAQVFFAGGNSFYSLVFANTSADGVTVSSSFEANYLSAETAVATQIAFASGVTATVGAGLTLTGDATTKNLTLKPAVESATWNLKVKGTAAVSGVTVSGSQATGSDIFASASTDAGGNAKWHFGTFSSVKWVGATSDAFDEPSNWEGGAVPDADTAVEINTDKPLTIASEVTVRELVVGGSAASSVLIKAPLNVVGAMVLRDQATVTADEKVTVGGSLVMSSGSTLTHSVNGTAEGNRVWVDVAGDVMVAELAAISADGKGFVYGGPGRATNSGGSHGGTGGTHGTAADCYGSIFSPTNSGSSGNSSDTTAAGGGVVRLVVAGTLLVDGSISADGVYHGNWYAGSGGSVWITCGRLQGLGRISANGGESGSGYHGAGGRVAVYLTEAGAVLEEDNGVAVEAYPGRLLGAPGTVYVQTADEANFGGTLKVVNHPDAGEFGGGYSGAYVQYPSPSMSIDRKRNGVSLVLGGYARLSLTDNVRVSSLEVLDQKPKVFLNGHVLKINQPKPKDWVMPSYVIPGEDADGNPGRIEWATGLILFLR